MPAEIVRRTDRGFDASSVLEGADVRATIDQYIAECRPLLADPLISPRTRGEYEAMFQELRRDGKVEWMKENVGKLFETLQDAHVYEGEFQQQLDGAVRNEWISPEARDRSLKWFRDPDLPEWYRKKWIQEHFPAYLDSRRALAEDRQHVLGQAQQQRFALEEIPVLRDLTDPASFFGRSFEERRSLVTAADVALRNSEGERRQLYDRASSLLQAAVSAQAMSGQKVGPWLRRIFDGPHRTAAIRAFVTQSGSDNLPELIARWTAVQEGFANAVREIRDAGVRPEGIPSLEEFLLLRFPERQAAVRELQGDLARIRQVRSQAIALLQGAQGQGGLDAGGVDRWIRQYLFNGASSVGELAALVGGNLHVRLQNKVATAGRFDRAMGKLREQGQARGMHVPDRSAFLHMHYDQQLAFLEELERRLVSAGDVREEFLRIRHLLDLGDWQEAEALIGRTRQQSLTDHERQELTSMDRYLRHYRAQGGPKGKEGSKSVAQIRNRLDQLREGAHPALREFYGRLLMGGNEYVHAFRWVWYNRIWCRDRKYLTDDREYRSLEQGRRETYLRHELGVRREGRRVVSDDVEGKTAHKTYIDACDYAPTNVHTNFSDGGSREALWEWMKEYRRSPRTLYWTNLIPHIGEGEILSEGIHRAELDRLTEMRRLTRELEQRGFMYSEVGPLPSLS